MCVVMSHDSPWPKFVENLTNCKLHRIFQEFVCCLNFCSRKILVGLHTGTEIAKKKKKKKLGFLKIRFQKNVVNIVQS